MGPSWLARCVLIAREFLGDDVFVMGNPFSTIIDAGKGVVEALTNATPKRKDFLALLSLLFALMRDLRSRPRNEVEAHIDNPNESPLFQHFPGILKDKELTQFICDYVRLTIIGNARSHEIEALMEQEISTIRKHKLKPQASMGTISEALPALGICAAVLGIVKAMGALDESPEVLGEYIGAALIGLSGAANAQDGYFAGKTIDIIVPFGQGGATFVSDGAGGLRVLGLCR